jgi:hypothetical protein
MDISGRAPRPATRNKPSTRNGRPAARRAMLRNGYLPIPVRGKIPVLEGWQNIVATDADIAGWESSCSHARNTGILTKTTPTVDIDVLDAEVANIVQAWVEQLIPAGTPRLVRVGRAPKRAILFRSETPFPKIATPFYVSEDGLEHRLEILGDGQQVVVFGIHPETGHRYTWNGEIERPWKIPRSSLPVLAEADARKLVNDAILLFKERGWRPKKEECPKEPPKTSGTPSRSDGPAHEIARALADRIESLCNDMLPNGVRQGSEWCVGSINGEAGQSLRVHLNGEKLGVWCDFAEESNRGDALDLVEAVKNLSTPAAMDWARQWLGWPSFRAQSATNGQKPQQTEQTVPKHDPNSKRNGPETRRVGNAPLSAKELNNMRFEPIKYVVPGVIVEGLTLLAAKPKMGKSWMMLHAAVAVARGGFTLGDIHCPEGDALYLALEDNLRRLQSRMTKLLGTQEWPARLFFRCEMPRLAEGGLQAIKDWIKTANHPRLVIIDTLAMVRAPKKRDESTYDADYGAVKELRALANEHGIAIVLVHHLRKQDADDAFDTVSGTLGLTGAPDTILVLKRDSSGSIVLHGRGRDLVEIEKAMTFNPDACIWTIAGEVREVRTSNERKTILAAMREIELPASPTAIAAAANLKHGNVKKLLPKLMDAGLIKKCDYGKYDLAAGQANA